MGRAEALRYLKHLSSPNASFLGVKSAINAYVLVFLGGGDIGAKELNITCFAALIEGACMDVIGT